MKKFLSLMAICAIIFMANCSRIEENNDPIIGVWLEAKTFNADDTSKSNLRKEWIFNDVYLGRYHEMNGNEITLKTDFKWSAMDGVYTIEYSGLEDKPNHELIIVKTDDGVVLEKVNGDHLAIRK